MTAVAGLDPSLTGTGVAHPDGATSRIDPRKLRGVDRLVMVRDAVISMMRLHAVGLVVIEGYSYASKFSHAHALGELGGVLRVALHEHDIPVVEVSPNARAKWATGKGNAAKGAVVSAVSAKTGITFPSDDECDAWVLRDIGVCLTTGDTALGTVTRERAAVLAALALPPLTPLPV